MMVGNWHDVPEAPRETLWQRVGRFLRRGWENLRFKIVKLLPPKEAAYNVIERDGHYIKRSVCPRCGDYVYSKNICVNCGQRIKYGR